MNYQRQEVTNGKLFLFFNNNMNIDIAFTIVLNCFLQI